MFRAKKEDEIVDYSGRDFKKADAKDLNLSRTRLCDANLSQCKRLTEEGLAGADLRGCKLPPDFDFPALKRAEELSKNAGKAYVVSLASSIAVFLTSHQAGAIELVTGRSASKLPVLGIDVSMQSFFLFAPLVLLGTYFVFHLYLLQLWSTVSRLPSVFPDGQLVTEKLYPWILNALVRSKLPIVRYRSSMVGRIEQLVCILTAYGVVPAVLILTWIRFLPSHSNWNWVLLLASLVSFYSARRFYRYVHEMIHEKRPLYYDAVHGPRLLGRSFVAWLLIPSLVGGWLTFGALNGRRQFDGEDRRQSLDDPAGSWFHPSIVVPKLLASPYGTFLNLRNHALSTRPDSWEASKGYDAVTGANLVGADMQGARLGGAFMAKADASRVRFDRADLPRANLYGATMDGTRFDLSDLSNADLRSGSVDGTVFSRANLKAAKLAGIQGTACEFRNADLTDANFDFTSKDGDLRKTELNRAIFENVDLTRADLSRSGLRFTTFVGRGGTACRFNASDLSNATFRDVGLQGAKFRKATLNRTVFAGGSMTGADFSDALIVGAVFGRRMQDVNMDRAVFQQTDLRSLDFSRSYFRKANLLGARLNETVLNDAKLSGAILVRANLTGAFLQRADLAKADLRLAFLDGCDLRGADLRGAKLYGATWIGAEFDDETRLDAGLDLAALGARRVRTD